MRAFLFLSPESIGAFFRPYGAFILGYTMRKLRELLEWILIAMDLYGLIDMVINFIKQHI